MSHRFAELMFTPTVKAVQERQGSRGAYERFEEPDAPAQDRLAEGERAFIAERDSFYMATVSETGWPYVQHRGGPPGFLKVLDDRTLGFVDYRGNRQYVSVGNLMADDRVSLFLVDYPNRRRLKILGRARIVDLKSEPDMIARLRDEDYDARIERGMVIRVEGYDWNCPQHITPRYTEAQIDEMTAPLLARLREAEARLAAAPQNALGSESPRSDERPAEPSDDQPLTLVLARSGERVAVAADQTALDALEATGRDQPSSCRTGMCGTCAIKLLAGEPDHRDSVLSADERAAGAFTPCVSRARSAELVIDL